MQIATQPIDAATAVRPVTAIVRGQPASDGAGVKLTRVVGTAALSQIDPILMLDAFGSDDPDAYIAGFPSHPHRGFETVTYMLAGRMRHRDNHGNEGLLGPGGVQWMTAGRGIVHSEMPEQESGLMSGFQLWLNLPAAEKMTEPRYRDIPADEIPVVETDGATVKVIAGRFGEARGPVAPTATDPLFLDVRLPAGGALTIPVPSDHAGFVYVYEGELTVGEGAGAKAVAEKQAAVLGDGDVVRLKTGSGARAVLITARPLREPVARYGPFVMNTPQEIQQAFADYQAGRF